jgi:hypothetical protein
MSKVIFRLIRVKNQVRLNKYFFSERQDKEIKALYNSFKYCANGNPKNSFICA